MRGGAATNTEAFFFGVPNFSSLNSRFSRMAMTAEELMPEWKIVPNHVGNAS